MAVIALVYDIVTRFSYDVPYCKDNQQSRIEVYSYSFVEIN